MVLRVAANLLRQLSKASDLCQNETPGACFSALTPDVAVLRNAGVSTSIRELATRSVQRAGLSPGRGLKENPPWQGRLQANGRLSNTGDFRTNDADIEALATTQLATMASVIALIQGKNI